MDLVESLIKVGFTRHESLIYLTLCKEGQLTGYEAAKLSGIPRSNAYLALAGLVDKGGAYRSEEEVVRYVAVPAQELVRNLKRNYERLFEQILREAPEKELPADAYITVSGRAPVLHKVKNMLLMAQERIYIALSAHLMEAFRFELTEAIKRGLKVVAITDTDFELNGASIYYHHRNPEALRLIADSSQVLTGEMNENEYSCVFSKNKALVQLIKESLTNEIKLIEMKRSVHRQEERE